MSYQATVLLVEDDRDDALFVRMAFKYSRPDIRLLAVDDGLEAVKYLQSTPPFADRELFPFPDAVLLDLQLRSMNGFQVLRWIRSCNCATVKQLPVVVLTGSLNQEDSQTSYQLGASSFVIKPCSLDSLKKAMNHIADRWLTRKALEPTFAPNGHSDASVASTN
jgi:CheY-like chemotaxis protein